MFVLRKAEDHLTPNDDRPETLRPPRKSPILSDHPCFSEGPNSGSVAIIVFHDNFIGPIVLQWGAGDVRNDGVHEHQAGHAAKLCLHGKIDIRIFLAVKDRHPPPLSPGQVALFWLGPFLELPPESNKYARLSFSYPLICGRSMWSDATRVASLTALIGLTGCHRLDRKTKIILFS